jgi:DNA-binding NtrC family response regulator
MHIDFIEKEHIIKVLKHHQANQRQTAISIGWALNTLKSKMEKYGIDPEKV